MILLILLCCNFHWALVLKILKMEFEEMHIGFLWFLDVSCKPVAGVASFGPSPDLEYHAKEAAGHISSEGRA